MLIDKIETRTANIGIIGGGYVGLPLSVEFASAGFCVTVFDTNEWKVNEINAGRSYIPDVPSSAVEELSQTVPLEDRMGNDSGVPQEEPYRVYLRATTHFALLADMDVAIICVPTPLKKTKDPDIQYILTACESVSKYLHAEMFISLESSTYPGTTDELMLPMFQQQGFEVGRDFYLCFSPERVDPGNTKWQTRNIPKVIGGITPQCTAMGEALYKYAVDTVIPVQGTRTAEMVKLLENTFRMVNIGLVNELATMCDKMGIDIWSVIDAAKTKPFGYMPFYPGGVGGHCIPIDPFYFSWKAKQYGLESRFIETAGHVNGYVPHYIVEKIQDALNTDQKPLWNSQIVVLGVAYKANVDDVRESPAIDICHILLQKGAKIKYYDPFVASCVISGDGKQLYHSVSVDDLLRVVEQADCVLVATDHDNVPYAEIYKHSTLIVDPKNAIQKRTLYPPTDKSGHCVLYKYLNEKVDDTVWD
jgi:UDP-N-acetyl-D-glucosamine dehydrogenase